MKVFKVEVMILDFDDVGAEGIKEVIENARYPNHCISPHVKAMSSREVDWSDDHPLNNRATCEVAYQELFRAV